MRPILAYVALLFIVLKTNGQTWPIHVEAENYSQTFGVNIMPCSEGGSSIGFANEFDWTEYLVYVPSDGVYRLSLRIAGAGNEVWITDSVWNVLGKVYFPATTSDQTYTTVFSYAYLKAGNRRLRLQSRTQKYSLNWFEVAQTGLVQYCGFESDWEMFSGGNVAWKADRVDSTNWIKQCCRSNSLTLMNQGPRKGHSSARFELTKSDSATWPNVRSEIYRGSCPSQDMWFGFSFMSPTDVHGDGLAHTIFQLHGTDDVGEGARSPCISMRVENDSFTIKTLWAAAAINTTYDGEVTYNLGAYCTNTWVDWVVHVKFAYNNTGILEVWRDGIKLFARTNLPNSFNDVYYPYPKFGIYKWGWNGWQSFSPYSTLIQYYDEIKIGGSNSNYQEVAP